MSSRTSICRKIYGAKGAIGTARVKKTAKVTTAHKANVRTLCFDRQLRAPNAKNMPTAMGKYVTFVANPTPTKAANKTA